MVRFLRPDISAPAFSLPTELLPGLFYRGLRRFLVLAFFQIRTPSRYLYSVGRPRHLAPVPPTTTLLRASLAVSSKARRSTLLDLDQVNEFFHLESIRLKAQRLGPVPDIIHSHYL